MKKFYQGSMRCAAVVLFVVAIVTVISGALPTLLIFKTMAHDLGGGPEGSQSLELLVAFLRGVSSAVWPFFGAAFLWRLDKYWGRGAAE